MPKKGQLAKLDTIKKEKYLELLREGGRRGASAKVVGVHRHTIANHMKKDKAFAKAVSEAEMDANEIIEDAMFEAARSGNTTAMQVWLYNRCPDRWADRRRYEVTGKKGEPIEHKVIHKLRTRLTALRGEEGVAEGGGDGSGAGDPA